MPKNTGSRYYPHNVVSEEHTEQLIASGLAVSDAVRQAVNNTNNQLPAYSHIADFEIMLRDFERTPKHSIKRFMYT